MARSQWLGRSVQWSCLSGLLSLSMSHSVAAMLLFRSAGKRTHDYVNMLPKRGSKMRTFGVCGSCRISFGETSFSRRNNKGSRKPPISHGLLQCLQWWITHAVFLLVLSTLPRTAPVEMAGPCVKLLVVLPVITDTPWGWGQDIPLPAQSSKVSNLHP